MRQFQVLKGFLVGDRAGATYAEAAARLNVTEAAVKTSGLWMRRRYRKLRCVEIAQTITSPDEVGEEIRNLFATLEL